MMVELNEAEGETETEGAEVSNDETLVLADCVEDIDTFELSVDTADEELVIESEGVTETTGDNVAFIEGVLSAEAVRVPPAP